MLASLDWRAQSGVSILTVLSGWILTVSHSCKTKQGQGTEQLGSSVEAQGDRRCLWEEVKAAQEAGRT